MNAGRSGAKPCGRAPALELASGPAACSPAAPRGFLVSVAMHVQQDRCIDKRRKGVVLYTHVLINQWMCVCMYVYIYVACADRVSAYVYAFTHAYAYACESGSMPARVHT